MFKVAFISMPWSNPEFPSIQAGLFSSIFRALEVPFESFHFDVRFVGHVGYPRYNDVAQYRAGLFAEWLFNGELFGDFHPEGHEPTYIDYLANIGSFNPRLVGRKEELLELRQKVLPAFLEECLNAAPWGDYGVIGLTCSFNQTIPSLCLAKKIKEKHPAAKIVLGGSAFDGEAAGAYHKAFPWIETIFCGDADGSFPEYVARIRAGVDASDLTGITWRENGTVHSNPPAAFELLDELPTPDFDSYFDELASLKKEHGIEIPIRAIPIETSRGCWWAQKKKCGFCGLSPDRTPFRSKSAERIISEIETQGGRYGLSRFYAIEMVMSRDFKHTLFERLKGRARNLKLFFEVRPDLGREDIKLLSEAGVVGIQPGIEAYNTHLLSLMNKGVTCMECIVLNKWATYYGMKIHYGILCHVPGERAEDYEDTIEKLPLLRHLQPPAYFQAVSLDRFSPYFENADAYGIRYRTSADWRYLYPGELLPEGGNGSLKFEFAVDGAPDLKELYRGLEKEIAAWRERRGANMKPPVLAYALDGDTLTLFDRRMDARGVTRQFTGISSAVYDVCSDRPMRPERIVKALSDSRRRPPRTAGATPERGVSAPSTNDVLAILNEFVRDGFMYGERGLFLGLAHPLPEGMDMEQLAAL